MLIVACLIGVGGWLANHYAFSFQRFTLAIAREHTDDAGTIQRLQTMMSPPLMGAFALFGSLAKWIGAGLLWWSSGALYAGGFLALSFVASAGVLPLFQMSGKFATLANREVARHMLENPDAAARLLVSIMKAKTAGIS